jgi:hypothetical protein
MQLLHRLPKPSRIGAALNRFHSQSRLYAQVKPVLSIEYSSINRVFDKKVNTVPHSRLSDRPRPSELPG